jgi:hypothetical protein
MVTFRVDALLLVPMALSVGFMLWALWNFSKNGRR